MSVKPDVSAHLYDAFKECLRNSDMESALKLYYELFRLGHPVGEILNALDRIPSNSEHSETATEEYPQSGFDGPMPSAMSEALWVGVAQTNARHISGLYIPHIAEGCGTEQPQAAKGTSLDELGPDNWEQLPRERVAGSEPGTVELAGTHTFTDCGGAMHSGDQKRLWPGNLPSIAKRIAFWALCTAAIVPASIAGFSFVHGGRDAEPTTTDIQSEISNGTKAPAIPGSVIGGSEALTKLLQSKDQVRNPDPSHPPNPLRSPEPDLSVSDPAQTVETGVRDAVFAGQPKAEASQKSEAGQSDAIEQLTQAAAAPPDLAHEPFSLVAQSPSAAPIGSAETEPHLDTAPPEASEPPKATLNALAPVDRGSSSSVSAPASVRAQKQDPLISPRAHTLSQLEAAVRAEKTDRGLRVILHSDKLFGSSADTLSEETADRDLKIISELLAAQRWRQIIVIGHEDEEQLAKQRANAVSAWLQAHASQHRPDFVEDARVRRAGKRQEARIEILLRHR